jgi:hypothetical protein
MTGQAREKIPRLGIGETIDYLETLYARGDMQAVVVAVKERGEDGKSVMKFFWHGFSTYAEQLGAIEMAKETMFKNCLEGSEDGI